jgi:tRNA(Ile)-lysidine synthase
MRLKFRSFIDKNQLLDFGDKVLLAVSGGIDSMAMLNLFKSCGYPIAVAHCNFALRDSESDGDEQFVSDYCKSIGVKLFQNRFSTLEYANGRNISVQVAARELRYRWFEELCCIHGFARVAVAHNRNDVAETMLINLTRGTGLKGLTGIKPKIDKVIRPLLFASRDEIESYVNENKIPYRNDSSNLETKYSRNRIRHQVIPELEKINAGAVGNLYSSSIFLGQAWEAIAGMLEQIKAFTFSQVNDEILYSIKGIIKQPLRQLFLIEELFPFGFSPSQVLGIENSLFSQPGKIFYSNEYKLVRDREFLIVTPIQSIEHPQQLIYSDTQSIDNPIRLDFKGIALASNFVYSKNPNEGYFDYSKLTFPLILRPWKPGDWFIPYGMRGRKKVSDFLIDQKVPLHQKENVYVLESEGTIAWVVGYRIDNRFKVTVDTESVWVCTLFGK